MNKNKANIKRTFKTEWFSKAAAKAGIKDTDLCKAIKQVKLGQAIDLGGGVFKKRLNVNRHRGIILAKCQRYWVYVYLFAKKDRENIHETELNGFRKLADLYSAKSDNDIKAELKTGALLEICHEDKIKDKNKN